MADNLQRKQGLNGGANSNASSNPSGIANPNKMLGGSISTTNTPNTLTATPTSSDSNRATVTKPLEPASTVLKPNRGISTLPIRPSGGSMFDSMFPKGISSNQGIDSVSEMKGRTSQEIGKGYSDSNVSEGNPLGRGLSNSPTLSGQETKLRNSSILGNTTTNSYAPEGSTRAETLGRAQSYIQSEQPQQGQSLGQQYQPPVDIGGTDPNRDAALNGALEALKGYTNPITGFHGTDPTKVSGYTELLHQINSTKNDQAVQGLEGAKLGSENRRADADRQKDLVLGGLSNQFSNDQLNAQMGQKQQELQISESNNQRDNETRRKNNMDDAESNARTALAKIAFDPNKISSPEERISLLSQGENPTAAHVRMAYADKIAKGTKADKLELAQRYFSNNPKELVSFMDQ